MDRDPPKQDRRRKTRRPKGAMIAIVGPDAAGKSTISRRLSEVLVERGLSAGGAHVGEPPATWITHRLRLAVKAVRKLLRMARKERSLEGVESRYPRLQAALNIILAYERLALVRRCHKSVQRGTVVILDRFPARAPGSANGPAIRRAGPLTVRLASSVERRLYDAVPAPDLVVRVCVPIQETILRNAGRDHPKPEEVIRRSHLAASRLNFGAVQEIAVDNMAPLESVVEQVGAAVLRSVGKGSLTSHG